MSTAKAATPSSAATTPSTDNTSKTASPAAASPAADGKPTAAPIPAAAIAAVAAAVQADAKAPHSPSHIGFVIPHFSDQAMGVIHGVSKGTEDGSLPFPEAVKQLMGAGVESYRVDYVARTKTFYSGSGQVAVTLLFASEGPFPAVAEQLDTAALKVNITDSQTKNQPWLAFSKRATSSGVASYIVFFSGKRVTYFGRTGDAHTEWFPGAGPAKKD